MKKSLLTLSGVIMLAALIIQTPVFTNSDMPQPARTGAPFDGGCATLNCHEVIPNPEMAGDISISIDGNELDNNFRYEPGQTYSISFRGDATGLIYGFQMTSVDNSNNRAGDFIVLDTSTTNDSIFMSREYINHKNASSLRLWTYNWTAPASDVGPITFYYTLNAGNNDGMATGDSIIQGSRTFVADSSTGIGFASRLNTSVYPNPIVDGSFNIQMPEMLQAKAVLFDLNGCMIQNWELSAISNRLELSESVGSGIYLLHINGGEEGIQTHRLVVN